MAAPVHKGNEQTTGVLIVAGPSNRLTTKRMTQLAQSLMIAAEELALASNASPLLKSANLGTWGNLSDKTLTR
jgi:hypothetical protein